VRIGIVCRVTDKLDDFIFVTKVDEDDTSVVSAAGDPACYGDFLTDMCFVYLGTIVCSHVQSFDVIVPRLYRKVL
jgi:hypothetical protein